jgi:CBS domain-containing protein
VLSLFEEALTVTDLVRHQQLFTVDANEDAAEAYRELAEHDFDQAPVRDVPIRRYVLRERLKGEPGPVARFAEPIPTALRVPESASLLDALVRLREHEYLFATHREHVTGVVARADLGQPAVSLLVLGLVTGLEEAFDGIIEATFGDRWIAELSEDRAAEIRNVFEERRRYNAEISLLRALNLDGRLRLIRKTQIPRGLGFESNTGFRKWESRLKRVRDCVAHGDGLLGAIPDPEEALEVLHELRAVADAAVALGGPAADAPER